MIQICIFMLFNYVDIEYFKVYYYTERWMHIHLLLCLNIVDIFQFDNRILFLNMQIHKRTIEKENKSTNKDRFLFTVYVNINDLVTNFGISFVLEYTSTNKKEYSFWFLFSQPEGLSLFLVMWRNNDYIIILDVRIWTKCLWFARRSYFASLFIFIGLCL